MQGRRALGGVKETGLERGNMLAVDIGNTNTRLARIENRRVADLETIANHALTSAGLAGVFARLQSPGGAAPVWIASVKPALNPVVESAARQTGLDVRFIRMGTDQVMAHSLSTPETTGVDRVLSALAAGERYFSGQAHAAAGYITIQCGSAATVDYVDGDGVFRGGYILPGPALWLAGLAHAAQLPDLQQLPVDWTMTDIGDNTRDAMVHGMAAVLPSCLDTAVAAIVSRYGGRETSMPVAVTGGWGEIAARKRKDWIADPYLCLYGVSILADRCDQ